MKILLLGYGKMGKAVEVAALSRSHEIVGRIGENNVSDFERLAAQAQVAIEFTSPDSAVENILKCLKGNLPVVCGSTGWLSKWEYVVQQVNSRQGALFYSSNFSLGVNLFFELCKQMAALMSRFEQYRPEIEEIHHIHKLDAPSGTAITLANSVLPYLPGFTGWNLNIEGITPNKLSITAIRQDNIPGTHTFKFDSKIDQIALTHTAFNREGFAQGAVLAAEWLLGKKGVFGMKDMLQI